MDMTSQERSHYSDIYDPGNNPTHVGHRWIRDEEILPDGKPVTYKRFSHYEGYGSKTQEKMDFINSINRDHPLWSPGGYGKSGNHLCCENSVEGKSLRFNESSRVRVIGDSDESEEKIDGSDRYSRTSWNFSRMLCDFVEKCSKRERDTFFDEGCHGSQWSENKELMEDFRRMFEWILDMKKTDPQKKICLSDQTIRDYPAVHFNHVLRVYNDYMDSLYVNDVGKSFKFNPEAIVFVPSVIKSPALDKRYPVKPMGYPPNKNRPRSTSVRDPMLPWNLCEESDKKILELDRKLQVLINLHGPVVCAKQI